MADRFVKDEYARIAASGKKASDIDQEAVRYAKIEADERAAKGLPPLDGGAVKEPKKLTTTGEGELPAFAGKTQWKKYLEKEAGTPQALARKKLDSQPPSKTLQIFVSSPTQSILSSSPSAKTDADESSTSLTTTLTPEHIPELIRPHLHIRSTFLVSSQPLLKRPHTPTSPESFSPPSIPPTPRLPPGSTTKRPDYVTPEEHALSHARDVTAKYVALPGEGTYYLVEFGTVEEARRVREELDDRVLGDGTVLDVWFTAETGEGEGEGEGLEWIEARGVGTEGWRRVEVEKLEQEREVERKRLSGIREHTGPEWKTLGAALDAVNEEEVEALQAKAVEEVKEKVEDVKESAESASSTIIEKIEETKESVVETAEEVKETVESKIEDVKPAVVEAVKSVKDALPSTSTIVEKASETKDTVVETAQDIKETVGSKIEEVTPSSVVEKVESVKETITDALPTTETISKKVEQAKEVVSEKVEAVKESAVEAKETVVEKIEEQKPAASSFVEKVAEKVEEAKEAVVEKAEEVKERVEEAVGGVKEKVEEAKEKVEKEVKEVKAEEKKGDEVSFSFTSQLASIVVRWRKRSWCR